MTDTHPTVPLIGRDHELERLEVAAGLRPGEGAQQGGAVLLAGDAGIGKTRLLRELAARASTARWQVVVGHCLDFGDSALPYLPFTEAFGRLSADPRLATDLEGRFPAVGRLLPGRRRGAGDDLASSTERSELFEAVHGALGHVAEQTPVLLVLEDVHWADHSTRDLIRFILARPFDHPVSVVVSYRSDDLHRRHPLRSAVAEWARLPGVQRLLLAPLADSDVGTLVRTRMGPGFSPADVQTIVRRAEGNAFFVEELLDAGDVNDPQLPWTLAELLLVRLDRLDEVARQVVRAASCAGRRVSHPLLSRVVELGPTELDQGLRTALDHNVLVQVGGDAYAFRHALLAEAVHDDLLPGERTRIHAAYVTALCDPEIDGTAAEVAMHARAAHDVPTALAASIEAGDDAMAVGGPEEAVRHFETALDLLTEGPHDLDEVDLTGKACDALIAAGHPYRALKLAQDRLRNLPDDARAEDRGTLLLLAGTAAILADREADAHTASEQAIAVVPDEVTPLRAKVESLRARILADRGSPEEAKRWAEQSLLLGERLGLRKVVAEATTTLTRIGARGGDPEEAKERYAKLVEQARSDGDLLGELRSLQYLGFMHYDLGQLAEARTVFEAAMERAAEVGRPWAPFGFDGRAFAATIAYLRGEWDDATRLVDTTGESPPPQAEAVLAAVGMLVSAGRGETEAMATFTRLRPLWGTGDVILPLQSGTAAIDLLGDSGDLEGAVRAHDELVQVLSSLWGTEVFPAQLRLTALLLGQLAASASTRSATEQQGLVALAEPLVAVLGGVHERTCQEERPLGPEGRAWAARAEAEHARLRWITGVDAPPEQELVAAWRGAVEAFGVLGHPFEEARSRVRLAAVQRAAGHLDESREHASVARETARRLGAKPLLAELRATAGPAPAGSDGAGQALTPREAEILALVAQGRTNGEIGSQLFISTKTVSVHVSNILGKLGASGRTEAAAIGRRRGLLPD